MTKIINAQIYMAIKDLIQVATEGFRKQNPGKPLAESVELLAAIQDAVHNQCGVEDREAIRFSEGVPFPSNSENLCLKVDTFAYQFVFIIRTADGATRFYCELHDSGYHITRFEAGTWVKGLETFRPVGW